MALLHNTEDLKKISDNHKYDYQKNTKDYKNIEKEKNAKDFKTKLKYKLDNLTQKNKYSSISKSNIAWFMTEIIVLYVITGRSQFGVLFTPIQTILIAIVISCLSAFNALRSAKIYRIGVYKKSNMFFIICHSIIFLSSLSFYL